MVSCVVFTYQSHWGWKFSVLMSFNKISILRKCSSPQPVCQLYSLRYPDFLFCLFKSGASGYASRSNPAACIRPFIYPIP